MGRIFAIGDLHGCSRTFRRMVLDTIRLQKEDVLYCLGDYIDRGPDSKGVIDFILQLQSDGYTVYALRGNHDQMMMDSGKDTNAFQHWTTHGGRETLDSFGVESYDALEAKYKSFFYKTQFYFESGNYILVHAGLNFKLEDPFEDTEAMMWLRNFKVDRDKLGDRIILHGHTPLSLEAILAQAGSHIIDLDGGCVYTEHPDFGHLVALNLGSGEFVVEKNCELDM